MAMPFFVSPPPPGSNDQQRLEYNRQLKENFGGCKEAQPKEGDLRSELLYAWWPKKVCGKPIWLRHYEYLFEYRTRQRLTPLHNFGVLEWYGGGWDLVSERIC